MLGILSNIKWDTPNQNEKYLIGERTKSLISILYYKLVIHEEQLKYFFHLAITLLICISIHKYMVIFL
jgi:hypothetical protein